MSTENNAYILFPLKWCEIRNVSENTSIADEAFSISDPKKTSTQSTRELTAKTFKSKNTGKVIKPIYCQKKKYQNWHQITSESASF